MTPEERAQFYNERDARTIAYGSTDAALERPITLVIGDAAASRPGQVALLALANMVARTQRRLHICLPDVPLRAHALLAGDTLAEAVADTVIAINPALDLSIEVDQEIIFKVPSDVALARVPQRAITVGIGADASAGFDVFLGWKGGRAELATQPRSTSGTGADVLGAATAACLGAAAVFHLSHDRPVTPVQLNLAERTATPLISSAEPSTRAGTTSIEAPLDVGDLVLIGAGALTHALAYWLAEIGVIGRRRVIDRDVAELHNTNRCLGMTAADAGWPSGLRVGTAGAKATIAARLFGAEPVTQWYHEWLESDEGDERPDLILPLANEHGARALVAARGEPIILHATTSPNWTAELHRHLPEIDDCPACRLPESASPQFACSTGPTGSGSSGSDAALPFLSAAAGLMLLVALHQLGDDGDLLHGRHNHWRLCFEQEVQLRRAVHQNAGCPHILPNAVRKQLRADPRRWDGLDRSLGG